MAYGDYIVLDEKVKLLEPPMPPKLLKSDFKLPLHKRFKVREARANARMQILIMQEVGYMLGHALRNTEGEIMSQFIYRPCPYVHGEELEPLMENVDIEFSYVCWNDDCKKDKCTGCPIILNDNWMHNLLEKNNDE